MADRASLLFSAKISEQAERYQDMVAEMKKIAQMAGEQELSVEERNLLSVGELDGFGWCQRGCWMGLLPSLPGAGTLVEPDPGPEGVPDPDRTHCCCIQATRTSWAPDVPPGAFCRAWSRVRLAEAMGSVSS